MWNAITRGWVYNIDQSQFELYLFQLKPTSDQETERARLAVPHFEDKPTSVSAWVQAIQGKELDALIYPEIGMDARNVGTARRDRVRKPGPAEEIADAVPDNLGVAMEALDDGDRAGSGAAQCVAPAGEGEIAGQERVGVGQRAA